jgi:hypothetical protein
MPAYVEGQPFAEHISLTAACMTSQFFGKIFPSRTSARALMHAHASKSISVPISIFSPEAFSAGLDVHAFGAAHPINVEDQRLD